MVSGLKLLKENLDHPENLKLLVEEIRQQQNVGEEILGFIAMYDSLNGDAQKMKLLLEENKEHILMNLPKKTLFFCSKSVMKYAALFVILALSSVFLYSKISKPSFELSAVFKDPGIPSYMSSESENSMELIMFNFKLKDFEKANELLQMARKKDPKNDTLMYYSGVVNYHLENVGKAKLYFQKVSHQKGPYQMKSLYYLGVCLSKEGNYNEARNVFESVVSLQDEEVYSYATDNLKELERYLGKQQ